MKEINILILKHNNTNILGLIGIKDIILLPKNIPIIGIKKWYMPTIIDKINMSFLFILIFLSF